MIVPPTLQNFKYQFAGGYVEGIKKMQIIYCYSLTNLRIIKWTRSNDHSGTDIRALLYKTYKYQEKGLIVF